MTTPTPDDDPVWDAINTRLAEDNHLELDDLDIPSERRPAVEEALRELAEIGIVEPEPGSDSAYQRGELFDLHLDADEQ